MFARLVLDTVKHEAFDIFHIAEEGYKLLYPGPGLYANPAVGAQVSWNGHDFSVKAIALQELLHLENFVDGVE